MLSLVAPTALLIQGSANGWSCPSDFFVCFCAGKKRWEQKHFAFAPTSLFEKRLFGNRFKDAPAVHLQGDEESVCKALTLAGKILEKNLAAARDHRQETEKRSAALWLSSAALLVILLI